MYQLNLFQSSYLDFGLMNVISVNFALNSIAPKWECISKPNIRVGNCSNVMFVPSNSWRRNRCRSIYAHILQRAHSNVITVKRDSSLSTIWNVIFSHTTKNPKCFSVIFARKNSQPRNYLKLILKRIRRWNRTGVDFVGKDSSGMAVWHDTNALIRTNVTSDAKFARWPFHATICSQIINDRFIRLELGRSMNWGSSFKCKICWLIKWHVLKKNGNWWVFHIFELQ